MGHTDFYAILGLIGMTTAALVKGIFFVMKKMGMTVSPLSAQPPAIAGRPNTGDRRNPPSSTKDDIKVISDQIETLASVEHFDTAILALSAAIADLKKQINTFNDNMQENASVVTLLKRDFENFNSTFSREVQALRQDIRSAEDKNEQGVQSLKEIVYRGHDLMHRIEMQVDKMDEFSRNNAIEFRACHKELGKEINEISRDIALVERTIQSQVQNTNAIKLR